MNVTTRTKRVAGVAGGSLVLAAALWGVAASHGRETASGWGIVRRADLALTVNVTGTLKAVQSCFLGPPSIADTYEYKISFMAPEGSLVRKGQPVLGFDTSTLERTLMEVSAQRDEVGQKIAQKDADDRMRRRNEELTMAEAESRLGKARLKVDVPEELTAMMDARRARLDLQLAEEEVEHLRKLTESARAAARAELDALHKELAHAEEQVEEMTNEIESMTIPSPSDGTVVYVQGWRGDKKKVGDACWIVERVIEIPDLRAMSAEGDVDEADAGAVVAGQRVSLRLDAHPDDEFSGVVRSVAKIVQPGPEDSGGKIVKVEIALDRTDPTRMRPGMRFRGTITRQILPHVLVLPLDAIFPSPGGPVAFPRSLWGTETVPVELGRRNQELVEVRRGLDEGDRVARFDPRDSAELGR